MASSVPIGGVTSSADSPSRLGAEHSSMGEARGSAFTEITSAETHDETSARLCRSCRFGRERLLTVSRSCSQA